MMWIERPRDAQTVLDSRPIGFHGIAGREEGTKRKREEKKEDELGSQASRQSQAFDRGWLFVAGRKSDLSGNLSRDTKFKSQNVFRGRESEWEKVKERQRERGGGGRRLCPGHRRGFEKWIRDNKRRVNPKFGRVIVFLVARHFQWQSPHRYWVTDGRLTSPTQDIEGNQLALICKISRHRAVVSFRIHSRLIGSWWKRQELFKLARWIERCLGGNVF